MPYKDPAVRKAKHKEYAAAYYANNKALVQATSKNTRAQKRLEWLQFKAGLSCTKCGFSHPAAMDFHHVGPKKYGVNELIGNGKFKLAYEEIAQCIVLCANCHRIHHFEEHAQKKGPKPLLAPSVD